MSSTFSELAATSLIEALRREPMSGRYLVTDVHGADAAATFRALLARADGQRAFAGSAGQSTSLRVVDAGENTVIIPYLVLEPPPLDLRDNRGGQGFVSAIRDTYWDAALAGEKLMLLVFSGAPNETLLTTMSQAVAEQALALPHLASLALRPPSDSSQALRRTLAELERLLANTLSRDLDADTVGRAAQAVEDIGVLERSEDVGRELYRLPWCLSDPDLFEYVGKEFQSRLERAIETRGLLESWAGDPRIDFDSEVRLKYHSDVADKISRARVGPAIRWDEFTLGELLGATPKVPATSSPLTFSSVPVSISDATSLKRLTDGKTIVVGLARAECTVTFRLSETPTGDETIHVFGYEGTGPPFRSKLLARLPAAQPETHISQLPTPREGWSFVRVVLTKGRRFAKSSLDEIHLAFVINSDGVMAYEADGEIDFVAQAFSSDENATLIVEAAGAEISAESVATPEAEYGEVVTSGAGFGVPVIQDELVSPAIAAPVQSPEHLLLEAWAGGIVDPGVVHRSLRKRPGGVVVADVGVTSRELVDSAEFAGGRWRLERYAIEHPGVTAFVIDANGVISSNQLVEELALGGLEPLFSLFLDAREVFFAELRESAVPSALAKDLTVSGAAENYVEAFASVLAAVPDGETGQLGYDRLLLVDSFQTSTGELLFSPTSPIAVATHRTLQGRVNDWLLAPPAPNFFVGDVGLISVQSLVPYMRSFTGSREWFESGYAPYPWRRYVALSARSQQERHPGLARYISRRIARFLDVHPTYADARRTIRLAFFNPGAATHVRDALLQVVGTYMKASTGERLARLPAFDLQLLADDDLPGGELGADLDFFMELVPEEGQRTDEALELMRRLSYTKGSVGEFLDDPKSFVHLAFLEGFFRPRPDLVEWSRDAHADSVYVDGLAADTERLPAEEPSATRFLRATWTSTGIGGAAIRIASRTTEIAASAAGVPVKRGIVRAADVLVPDWKVPQLYDRATWVVHIDPNVGLELFAPQDLENSTPYILDYTDQETREPGTLDGITATSQVGPYTARIADVLGEAVGAEVSEPAARRLLRTLNLISGRWGLEMLRTTDNVLRGRLATALAAQALEQVENLHGDPETLTIVIALDELLRVTGAEGLPTSQGWAARAGVSGGASDDLLILAVPLTTGTPRLRGRIVEVKYRANVASSAEAAAVQLEKTHRLLTDILVDDREPGRLFQARHLSKLILRYASRHVAYGLRSGHPVLSSGREALSRVAAGDYDLSFDLDRSGLLACGDYVSVEPGLAESSLKAQATEFGEIVIGRIRIGRPVIEALLVGGTIGAEYVAPLLEEPDNPAENEAAPASAYPSEDQSGGGTAGQGRDAPSGRRAAASPTAGGEIVESSDLVTRDAEDASVASMGVARSGRPFAVPDAELRQLAQRLDDVLTSYNLPVQPIQHGDAVFGPNTIRFRVRMGRGGTIAQIEARERDIMRELGLTKALMVGQEGGFVTVDVPRNDPITVRFRDLLPALSRKPPRGQLPVLFGVDAAGIPRIEDIAQLPHLLVAGTTGSGKSVFLSSVLGSLALLPSSGLEVVLIDVKGLDFAPFSALPHLRKPPITSAGDALELLDELYATERERRHRVLTNAGAQSILDYYSRLGGDDLTQIVVIIDEFSNLLGGDRATGSKLEDTIQLYAEIMRSFGIYLVIATQRPSADIVTGRIKANLPARCAFRLPTYADSMTILGRKGAEQLLGNGDMLFYRDGIIERLQAPLATAEDVLAAAE